MGRPNNQAGCTKFGKFINGQGAIRVGRVSKFFEINKQACPFIRQVRVPGLKPVISKDAHTTSLVLMLFGLFGFPNVT